MSRMIEVKYENNVLRPLTPLKGLNQNETAWIILCQRPNKKALDDLIGTLTSDEAQEMQELINKEFSHIEGDW